MIVRQLFDQETWTYTYLMGDEATREAVLRDAVLEQVDRDWRVLSELGQLPGGPPVMSLRGGMLAWSEAGLSMGCARAEASAT